MSDISEAMDELKHEAYLRGYGQGFKEGRKESVESIEEGEEIKKLLNDLYAIINCVEDEVPKEWKSSQGRSQDYTEGYHRAIYGTRILIHARGL